MAAKGVNPVPLMLIQVDNAVKGEADSVARVKDMLSDYGVDPSVVAVHTSGEPDPFFHTLAYDETREILIFRMVAATGFDAPRACTLVSLRQTVGPEFGLQILGRIMRVHQRVQPLHPYASDPPRADTNVLDYGDVFLANPGQQTGIISAAEELKAIRDGIQTVTDNVVWLISGRTGRCYSTQSKALPSCSIHRRTLPRAGMSLPLPPTTMRRAARPRDDRSNWRR